MSIADHINITIHRDGESTGDPELDEFLAKMSEEIFEKLRTADKMTREQADEAFVGFFCKNLRGFLLDMSDEDFGELLTEFVAAFHDPQN